MPTPRRRLHWAIPDDWEENDGSQAVVFCIPNSLQWKATITGLVTQLLQGRSWDGSTGNIKQTQEIGREVFESMAFLCLEDLGNIVTAINQLTAVIEGQGASGGGCGCAPAGKDSSDIPPLGEEGEPPPTGYVDFTTPGDDKCIQTHILLDDIETFLQSCIDAGVQQITWATIGTMEAALVIVLANLTGGPVVWALTILTAIGALVWALLTFEFDLQRILDITLDKRDDLICAAYTAPDNTEAWNAMQAIYTTEGAQAGDLLFLEAAQITHMLFTLFFLPDDAQGEAMQQAIDDYGPATCDCPGNIWIYTIGTVDQPDRIYDAVVDGNMVDYTTYWEHEGPNNVWSGLATPAMNPDPPVIWGNPTTLTWRIRYDYLQPINRGGWTGITIAQSSINKYQNTWVCASGCYGVWQSVDVEASGNFNTEYPGADPIYFYIQGEKDHWRLRNVLIELIENP